MVLLHNPYFSAHFLYFALLPLWLCSSLSLSLFCLGREILLKIFFCELDASLIARKWDTNNQHHSGDRVFCQLNFPALEFGWVCEWAEGKR